MNMEMTLIILGSLLLTAAIVMAFRPSRWSAPVAYIGLWLFILSGNIVLSVFQEVFWGLAAAIVLALNYTLPAGVVSSNRGVAYIAGGTLGGTLVGMIVSGAGMIIGSVLGAFFGALAYCRTPGGRDIRFPSAQFVNYLAAKVLPAIITFCIIGIVIALLASQYAILSSISQ